MKNLLKTMVISVLFIISCVTLVFAETSDGSIETNRKAKNENMIIGQIQNIDANNITIIVATRNFRTKNDENNEKTANENKTKYNLTNEKKIINIQNAELGRKNNEKSEDSQKRSEKLTYSDYKIGDFVRITLDNDNSTVAKRMRLAEQGVNKEKTGNYKGNYQGNYQGSRGKGNPKKNQN